MSVCAILGKDNCVSFAKLENNHFLPCLQASSNWIQSMHIVPHSFQWSPQGRYLEIGGSNSDSDSYYHFCVDTHSTNPVFEIGSFLKPFEYLHKFTFAPDDSWIAMIRANNAHIRFENGLTSIIDDTLWVVPNPKDSSIVAAVSSNSLALSILVNFQSQSSHHFKEQIKKENVEWSPDGQKLVVCDQTSNVFILDGTTLSQYARCKSCIWLGSDAVFNRSENMVIPAVKSKQDPLGQKYTTHWFLDPDIIVQQCCPKSELAQVTLGASGTFLIPTSAFKEGEDLLKHAVCRVSENYGAFSNNGKYFASSLGPEVSFYSSSGSLICTLLKTHYFIFSGDHFVTFYDKSGDAVVVDIRDPFVSISVQKPITRLFFAPAKDDQERMVKFAAKLS
jgi:hypothetical protein